MRRASTRARPGRLAGPDRGLLPLSLLASVAANDGEELATMARSLPATVERAPARIRPLLRRVAGSIDQRYVDVAIGTMCILYLAAAIDGWRSAGRGRLFQDVQLVFGAHGFGHLLASAVSRGYTTGVASSPTVVLPQWWWAASRMGTAGVPRTWRFGRAVAVVGGWLAVSHALGSLAAAHSRRVSRRAIRGAARR